MVMGRSWQLLGDGLLGLLDVVILTEPGSEANDIHAQHVLLN